MYNFNDFKVDLIKDRVKSYIFSLYSTDLTCFRLCNENSKSTLMSTSFAIICLELIDGLNSLSDSEKRRIAARFLESQDAGTGLFIDPLVKINLAKEQDFFSAQYITVQTTCFVLSALDALNSSAAEFRFLDNMRDENFLISWLDGLNWSSPWSESNKVMFLLQIFSYEAIVQGNPTSLKLVHAALDWLDSFQDKKTGFWGTDKGAPLFHGMAGAFHIYFFYIFFKRKIRYMEKIIDNTLALQVRDGLFYPFGGGGACEDLDAIDILVKFSELTDYREKEIKRALLKAANSIIRSQQDDGGFPWALRPRFSFTYWYKFINPFHSCWHFDMTKLFVRQGVAGYVMSKYKESNHLDYSGWDAMKFKIAESDLWSTWFRTLAIALISERYKQDYQDPVKWHFRDKPSLGFHV